METCPKCGGIVVKEESEEFDGTYGNYPVGYVCSVCFKLWANKKCSRDGDDIYYDETGEGLCDTCNNDDWDA